MISKEKGELDQNMQVAMIHDEDVGKISSGMH